MANSFFSKMTNSVFISVISKRRLLCIYGNKSAILFKNELLLVLSLKERTLAVFSGFFIGKFRLYSLSWWKKENSGPCLCCEI